MTRTGGEAGGDDGPRVSFFGGGFDTHNLGVAALTESVIHGLDERIPGLRMTVFSHTKGVQDASLKRSAGELRFEVCGARWSKRFYRFDSLSNIRFSTRLRGFGNPAAKRVLASSAVLDISGGDSFTDLYGDFIFRFVVMPKRIAIENGLPLILLPQTFGPFNTEKARKEAEFIVRGAALAYARDDRSYALLRELAGDTFDPEKHRVGVDVAFLLPVQEPDAAIDGDWRTLLSERRRPVVGFNVSGLILNDPERARKAFGLRCDYERVVTGFLRRLLAEEDVDVLLVPHVMAPHGHYESDPEACEKIAGLLEEGEFAGRIHVAPTKLDQAEAKWVISQCDWFCGTRMHSAIAALSTGVPVAAIAYSVKTKGVFNTCGVGSFVVDPRELDTEPVLAGLWDCWERREESRSALAEHLPRVKAVASEQMDVIASFCR